LPDVLFSNQKSQFWVNFWWPWNGKCWYILWQYGIFYRNLLQFMAVCYSLWSFGIFSPICFVWTKKNLATLLVMGPNPRRIRRGRTNVALEGVDQKSHWKESNKSRIGRSRAKVSLPLSFMIS
jgi:hypothetical protein